MGDEGSDKSSRAPRFAMSSFFSWKAIGSLLPFGSSNPKQIAYEETGLPPCAIDVIAVQRKDGTIAYGPFHVRLSQAAKEDARTSVKVTINSIDINLFMKLGLRGEAFFVEKTDAYKTKNKPKRLVCNDEKGVEGAGFESPLLGSLSDSTVSLLQNLQHSTISGSPSASLSPSDVMFSVNIPIPADSGSAEFGNTRRTNTVMTLSGHSNSLSLSESVSGGSFSIKSVSSTSTSSLANSPGLYVRQRHDEGDNNTNYSLSGSTGGGNQVNDISRFPSLPILYSSEENGELHIYSDDQTAMSPTDHMYYNNDNIVRFDDNGFGNVVSIDELDSDTHSTYHDNIRTLHYQRSSVLEIRDPQEPHQNSGRTSSPYPTPHVIMSSSAPNISPDLTISPNPQEEGPTLRKSYSSEEEFNKPIEDIPLSEIFTGSPASGPYVLNKSDSDNESYTSSLSQDEGDDNGGNLAYRYKKTLIPTKEHQEELAKVVNAGKNDITYELDNGPPLRSELHLWPCDARIVVIDLEGAITSGPSIKTNSNGILSTLFFGSSEKSTPRDQVHEGFAQLLNGIADNGYKILYLTQNDLKTQDQLDQLFSVSKLPPGPVVNHPDEGVNSKGTLLSRPEIFKAAVMRGLKNLFSPKENYNPFYACFGQSEADMRAYSSYAYPCERHASQSTCTCGVHPGKIFVVDAKGDISTVQSRTVKRSFRDLQEFKNDMFPPVADSFARKNEYKIHVEQPDDRFSNNNFWATPIDMTLADD